MTKSDAIANFLTIRQEEKPMVLLLFGYSFCISLGLYIYYTAATTLFLTKFDGAMLPVAYIAGGLFLFIIAKSNSFIQKYIKFSSLAIGLVFSLTLSLVILLICYEITENKWIIFLLYLWIRANLFVFSFTFWVSASRVFDLGQAKRLYSLIGTGEVLASIAANFLVKTLISEKIVQVEELLYIALIFIGCSLFFISRIATKNRERLSFKRSARTAPDATITSVSKKYSVLMYLLGLIPLACLYIIEFSFSVDSKAYFPDKEQLAIFLGQFLFICSIIEFLVKGVLFRFVAATYGIMSGLILMPVSLIIVTILLFFMTAINVKVFFLILISRFLITSVRRSFSDTSYQLLYQPIPGKESIKLQNQVETYAKPLGYVIAGLSLIILLKFSLSNTIYVYSFLLIFLIIWAVLAFMMQKEYKSTLLNILSLTESPENNSSKIATPISTDQEIINNANLEFEAIISLSESTNSEDRKQSACLLTSSGRHSSFKYIIKLLEDKDISVRLAAITASPQMNRPEVVPYLLPCILQPELKSATLTSLHKIGESAIGYFTNYVNKNNNNIDVLISLIETAKIIGGPKASRFLRSKLVHQSNEVVDKAIESLIEIGYTVNTSEESQLIAQIDLKVDTYLWIVSAEIDLKKSEACNTLVKALSKERKSVMLKILKILSLLRGDKKFDKIVELMFNPESKAKSYLADLVSFLIELEEVKMRVLTLFENISDYEILLKYQDRYPQQYLSPEQRLLSIINKDNLSVWTKALALKQLLNYTDEKAINALAANTTAESIVLAETALFGLMKLNPARFIELSTYFNAKDDRKYAALCLKVQSYNDKYDLAISKAEALVFSRATRNWNLDYLQTIIGSLTVVSLEDGQLLEPAFGGSQARTITGLIVIEGSIQITNEDYTETILAAFDCQSIPDSVKSIRAIGNSSLYVTEYPLTVEKPAEQGLVTTA
jgi:AAA family ATP:ADP antiporter